MSYQATAAVGLALLAFAVVVSVVVDKRATAALVGRGEESPRFVKKANRRWLLAWFVVWLLGIMLAKEDPDNREAAVVVVPMILAQGPWAFWFLVCIPRDLVEGGADPTVASRTVRAGKPFAAFAAFLCVVALAYTFRV